MGQRLRILVVATALLLAIFTPYYVATLDLSGPLPRDGTSLVVGRDFLNLWLYGRAALAPHPAQYYDLATYWRLIEGVAGPGYPGQQWSYPPTVLLIAAPFGTLPYLAALVLWTMIGIGAFTAALRLWTREPRILLVLIASPAAVFGLISGQFAYLGAAAILAILRWREDRPLLAGVLLGLLTIKPQLGLLFPVLLLATGHWRMVAVAAATGIALAAVTALVWGPEVWTQYVAVGLHNQSLVLSDPAMLAGPFMPTMFMNLRGAGASIGVAAAVQAGAALIAIVLVWWVFRRRPPATDVRANTLFLAAGIFGSPYIMAYDVLALTAMAVLPLLVSDRRRLLPLLVFFLPLLQMVAGSHGLAGPALIPLLLAVQLLRARS